MLLVQGRSCVSASQTSVHYFSSLIRQVEILQILSCSKQPSLCNTGEEQVLRVLNCRFPLAVLGYMTYNKSLDATRHRSVPLLDESPVHPLSAQLCKG